MVAFEELSPVGLGMYRMSLDDREHNEAFKLAVQYGCNLIDTASNYQYGASEELIGRFIHENPSSRLFILTKAGYMTHQENQLIKRLKEKKSEALGEVVKFNTTTHCIHPDFLRTQIKKSLKRLNRKWLDGFLIHNPEYYLRANPTNEKVLYYERIKKAFELLEELAHKRLILYYGVSSNTMANRETPLSTNLQKLLEISGEVSSNSHFRLAQFPFNFFEQDACEVVNNSESMLSFARNNGLVTFGNRPLNCHAPQGFVRLAMYKSLTPKQEEEAKLSFNNFVDLITQKLRSAGFEGNPVEFEIIEHLTKNWKNIGNHSAVDSLFGSYLGPFLDALYDGTIPEKNFVSPSMPPRDKKVLLEFYEACKLYSIQTMSKNCQIAVDILKNSGELTKTETRSLPVVACEKYLQKGLKHVLVGMTKRQYVEEMRDFF